MFFHTIFFFFFPLAGSRIYVMAILAKLMLKLQLFFLCVCALDVWGAYFDKHSIVAI